MSIAHLLMLSRRGLFYHLPDAAPYSYIDVSFLLSVTFFAPVRLLESSQDYICGFILAGVTLCFVHLQEQGSPSPCCRCLKRAFKADCSYITTTY